MMNFSGAAGAASDFDLLPKGLLVYANLTVRGLKASASGGRYIDVELTVDQGQPYAGRKLWDMIGDPFHQGNSEKYRQMGMVAVSRILEAGRGAGPNNPAAYQLEDFSQLSGLRVPIKVGIEEGNDGHDDKNRVAEWLTPNPASQSGFKGFQKLASGDHGLSQNGPAAASGFGGATGHATPAPSQANTGGFGQGGSAAAPAQPVATTGFGNGPGFQQPPADSSGQSGAANGATSADSQSNGTGAPASPSNTPGWLSQAGASAQG
jgi:hypothetical protein